MRTENAVLDNIEIENLGSFDFDELESSLEIQMSELSILEDEQNNIGNPNGLVENMANAVWEQFMNQIAVTAGEDFIKGNKGLSLDLRNSAHIQTSDNFANGKIATHNHKIDYQERYDNWHGKMQHDVTGKVITHKNRAGQDEATLVKGVRGIFDNGRPTGSRDKGTDMDHTVSAGEIIRDKAANAHLSEAEQVAFANSSANLNEMDSSQNRSKSDMSMTDWLNRENARGQKPNEIFDISEQQDKAYREKDKEARAEFDKVKSEGEERSVKAGKATQRAELLNISGKALRGVILQLIAELAKEIFRKLISWLKEKKRSFKSLYEHIKQAVGSFVSNLKRYLINTTDSLLTTIATAIWGPIVSAVKKAWIFIKQGWKSIKEAYDYMKDPKNNGQSISVILLEVSKIVTVGLTAAGAIVLGEVLSKQLLTIPIFATPIPLLGNLADLIGVFMGGLISGVVGALVINLITNKIANIKKNELTIKQIAKGNEVIATQEIIIDRYKNDIATTSDNVAASMLDRHKAAAEVIAYLETDINNIDETTVKETGNETDFDDIDRLLHGLK